MTPQERLALALQYQKQRDLGSALPSTPAENAARPVQEPKQSWLDKLSEAASGVGYGLGQQVEGLGQMARHPLDTLHSIAVGAGKAMDNPSAAAQAAWEGLKQSAGEAVSSPFNLGQAVGANVNINPRKLAAMLESPAVRELTVYHGTPHRFPATEANPLGEFDASKIGTGEGAQAYGHGLYLAENPNVAESYKWVHGGNIPEVDAISYKGNEIYNLAGIGPAALRPVGAADLGMPAGLREFPSGGTDASITNFGVGATPAKLKKVLPEYSADEIMALQSLINTRGDGDKAFALLSAKGKNNAAKIAQENASNFNVTTIKSPTASLYHADLPDEMIDRMLDWDKPFFDQSQEIKDFAKNMLPPGVYNRLLTAPTGDFVEALGVYKGGKTKASEYLRNIGIPGIKYLDAGSRGQGGSGTRNFVIFPGEEKNLKILERK